MNAVAEALPANRWAVAFVGLLGALLAAAAMLLIGVGRLDGIDLGSQHDGTPLSTAVRLPATNARDAAQFAALPFAAQDAVSRGLGAVDHRFWARRSTTGAAVLANPGERMTATVSRTGVRVATAAGGTVALSGLAIGRGDVRAVDEPSAQRIRHNRVVDGGHGVSAWVANGPLGIEQGFTIARRPAGVGALVISQRVSGGVALGLGDHGRVVVLRNGRSTLTYSRLSVSDARGRALPARFALSSGRLSIVVRDAGARYPLHVDPTIQNEIADLTASPAGGTPDPQFGNSVAIDGSTIVIGEPNAPGGEATTPTGVYVWTEPTGGWASSSTPTVILSDSGGADALGSSVAISGTTIVAGAPTTGPVDLGAVRVWTEPAGGWSQAGSESPITLTQPAGLDGYAIYLGLSVAISGDTIVAGSDSGAVDEWTEPPTGWANSSSDPVQLTISGGASAHLGEDVVVSGPTIVAGSFNDAAYVFAEPTSGGWQSTSSASAVLTDSLLSGDAQVGYGVAIDGDTIAATAPLATVDAVQVGAVDIYNEPPTGWATTSTAAATLTPGPGEVVDSGPADVVISSSLVLAGGTDTGGSSVAQGAVLAWTEPGTGWSDNADPAALEPADDVLGNEFGANESDIAVDGSTAVVGAREQSSGTEYPGAAFVFSRPAVLTAPAVTGAVTVGGTLTCSTGSWSGSPTTYTYQWNRGATTISGATSSTYSSTAADAGATLTCVVTASNGLGSASSTSNGVSVGGAVKDITPPSVSGTPLPGDTLTCNPGTWTGSPSFTYSWQVNHSTVAGATSRTYVVTILDEGQTITCAVAASAPGSSATSASSTGTIVAVNGTLTCPKPSGAFSASRIGPLALGETQTQARHALKRFAVTHYGFDDFCLYGGWGIRGAYKSHRFVLLLTANPFYKIKEAGLGGGLAGISPGLPISLVAKRLHISKPFVIGLNDWYVAVGTASNDVFKVRHGVIQEIGIANRRDTETHAQQKRFLSSFRGV